MVTSVTTDGEYYAQLKAVLANCKTTRQLYGKLVNLPFEDKQKAAMLSLGHMILALVNKKNGTLDRIALSNTESARGAVNYSVLPFKAIRIPLSNKENYIGIAIRTKKIMATTDWGDTFTPVLTRQEARFNQAGAGVGCSVIYPLPGVGDGAAFVFSYYEPLSRIGDFHHKFMKTYTDIATQELKKHELVY